jgi:tetratricopeptide (TPR) repeat protein
MSRDVFAGRRSLVKTFRESLAALEWDTRDSKNGRNKKQKEALAEAPRLFVICGEAGSGKSALVRRLVAEAESFEQESKKGLKTILVDFEDSLFTRNILSFTPRMIVHYLHGVLADPSLGLEEHFSEYVSVERRLDHVIAKVSALRRDEWLKEPDDGDKTGESGKPAQKAASLFAGAVDCAPPHARTARQEAEAAFLRWLRDEKRFPEEDCDLFENADYRLTKALVNGLVTVSAEHPLLLAIDNLDRVVNPLVHQWLRSVFMGRLFERKNKVIAVVSGRVAMTRQYRNDFSEDRLCAVSLDRIPLSRLDIDECNKALHLGLSDLAVCAVESATEGVPMVVRDILTYAQDGAVAGRLLDAVAGAVSTQDKLSTIVHRFFEETHDARAVTRVVHLAMLGRVDAKICAGLWNVPVSDIAAEVAQLSEKFPFIESRGIHDGVLEMFRAHCVRESALPSSPLAGTIREFAESAYGQYDELVAQLDSALPGPDRRFVDERFESAFLGRIAGVLWYGRERLTKILPGAFCQCLLYNQVLAGRILAAAREFSGVLPPECTTLFNSLSAGFLAVEGSPLWGGESPSAAERAMLGSIEAATETLTPSQKAMLKLRFAACAYRSGEYIRALEELDACELGADESDAFRDLVMEGYCGTGIAFVERREFDKAIHAFGKAAEIRPDSFDAWYNLAHSHASLGLHEQACDSFAKAAACNPESYDAYLALGTEQVALNKHDKAAISYGRAVELNPAAAETWHALGKSHAALGRHADAVEAFRNAVTHLQSNAEILFDMATSQALAGRGGDAVDTCKKILGIDPAHWRAARLLGVQLAQQRLFPEAAVAFDKAASVNPGDESLWYELGSARLQAGDAAGAVQPLQEAIGLKSDFADAFNKLGLALFAVKKYDEAVTALTGAVTAAPGHFEAYNNLGNAYSAAQEPEKALDAYTKSAGANPDFGEAWFNLGVTCRKLGRFADSLEPFSKAAALSPDKPEILIAQGHSFRKLDKNDDAVGCFAKAAELSPQSYEAWFELGCALARVEKHDDAVAAFVKATGISPEAKDAWRRLGISHAARKRHDAAIAAFSKVVSLDASDGDAWHLLGVSNQEDGRFAEAVNAYREATKVLPEKQASWHNAGLCSYYQNKYNDAVELLVRAKELGSDNKDTLYALALAYHAQGNYGEAENLYRRALELAPEMSNARTNLALSLHALGRFAEAVVEYEKIVAEHPENADMWFNMGLACDAQGKTEQAVAAWTKTVEIAPDKLAAWSNRGASQMALELYADAIVSFTKVIERQDDNADAWANVARASYYLGRYESAVAAYEKVSALKPGDAGALGGLGLTYYTMGNYPKAIEASERALAISPGELWIQVNLALAAVLALNLDKARIAFEKIIELAATPEDLLHAIASLKELVARNPNLVPAKEILATMEDAWRKLRK